MMQLFTDSSFFLWLIVLTIPAFILGLMERSIKVYGFATSLLFVWLSMGGNRPALIFLAIYLIWEYGGAIAYERLRMKKGRKAGTYYLFLLLSILPLALNKFVPGRPAGVSVFGFLGISYMTFKAAQVIIQIYDGQIKEVGLFPYLYMMIFFPVLTSGPIDRSERFRQDLEQVPTRAEYLDLAGEGIFRIFLGLLYKIVLAAIFYQLMQTYGMERSWTGGLIYMYTYGFYLFFDFAGYSLMAVGASYLFGIRTPDNFNRPFQSLDLKEFWDRWHISLSHWFRDFVFSRVSMDLMRTRKLKSRLTVACIAFIVNMGLMGLWHGTKSCYLLYGLYHGVLLSLTEIYQKKSKFHKKHRKTKWYRVLEWFVTFQLVMIGFFLFSGRLEAYL